MPPSITVTSNGKERLGATPDGPSGHAGKAHAEQQDAGRLRNHRFVEVNIGHGAAFSGQTYLPIPVVHAVILKQSPKRPATFAESGVHISPVLPPFAHGKIMVSTEIEMAEDATVA